MLSLDNHPSGRHFLQIPGPSPVPDRILRAMSLPTIDHRGPEFGVPASLPHRLQRAHQTRQGSGDSVHAVQLSQSSVLLLQPATHHIIIRYNLQY